MPPELRVLGDPALKKHPVGQETVNGIATTKYAIDETVPEGHATGTLWLSRDGIPMRLAGSFTRQSGKVSTVRWELSHVKIGPQPAALFEAPQGFSKLPPEAIAPLLGLKLKSASALSQAARERRCLSPNRPRPAMIAIPSREGGAHGERTRSRHRPQPDQGRRDSCAERRHENPGLSGAAATRRATTPASS